MKTNKYGTPKERIGKICLAIFFILIVFLISGAGKRFYLPEYEEECYVYDTYEKVVCYGDIFNFTVSNETYEMCYNKGAFQWGWTTTTEFNLSKCLKYHLVRNAD